MVRDFSGSLDLSKDLEADGQKEQGQAKESQEQTGSYPDADDKNHVLEGEIVSEQKTKRNVKKHKEFFSKPDESAERHDLADIKRPYQKYLPAVFLIIAIILCAGLRSHYATLPITDDWAMQAGEASLMPQALTDAKSQFPFLSEQEQLRVARNKVDETLKTDLYKKALAAKSEELKQLYKDPAGNTYLFGIDGYTYFADMRSGESSNFPGFFGYWFHRLYRIFDPQAALMQSASLLTTIFVCLSLIPLFFLARKAFGEIPAFIAILLFGVHPEFLMFAPAGLTDTNAFNIFFMLMFLWLFVEALDYRGWKKSLAYGAGAIVTLLLFYWTWAGFFIPLVLAAVAAVAYYKIKLSYHLMSRYGIRIRELSAWTKGGIFAGISLTIVGLVFFFGEILGWITPFLPEKIRIYLNLGAESNLYPAAFELIIEQRNLGLAEIISKSGGTLVFLLFIAGSLVCLYKALWLFRKTDPGQVKAYLIIVLSAIAFLAVSTRLVRFYPYSLPFICMLAAVSAWYAASFVSGTLVRSLDIKDKRVAFAFSALLLLLLALPAAFSMGDAFAKVRLNKPIVDDPIYDSARDIAIMSDSDAKVTVWWDRGHFYYALAQREVNLRAAPRMPDTYWMAKAWLATDENLSRGIIRMLNCGNAQAATDSVGGTMSESVEAVEQVLAMDRDVASAWLEENGISTAVLRYTHCEPSENFVVVMDDQMSRISNAQYYANWDFVFGEIAGMTREDAITYLMSEHGKSREEATNLYRDSVDYKRENFHSIPQWNCQKSGDEYSCQVSGQTIRINIKTRSGNFRPSKLYIVDGLGVDEIMFENATSPLEMAIYDRDGFYYAIVTEPEMMGSMYVRWLILQGQGLSNFELISEHSHPAAKKVVTYKVNW